jgi:hypothetical protein
MSGRSRHVIALVLLLGVAAFVGWGCGGGEDETSTSTIRRVTTTAAAIGGSETLLNTQVQTTDATPTEYTQAVEQQRPIVLLFYVPGGADDVKVLDTVSSLQPSFENYVFLLYDYKQPDAYGDLSLLLKVNYPPQLVLVNGSGVVKQIWNGYVDEGTLNQGLVNLEQS